MLKLFLIFIWHGSRSSWSIWTILWLRVQKKHWFEIEKYIRFVWQFEKCIEKKIPNLQKRFKTLGARNGNIQSLASWILEQACSSSRTKTSYASSAPAAAGLSATLATNSRPQCRSTARGLVQTTIVVKSKNSFPLYHGSVCAAVPRRLSNTLSSRSLCMVAEPISLCIQEIWVQLQLNGE